MIATLYHRVELKHKKDKYVYEKVPSASEKEAKEWGRKQAKSLGIESPYITVTQVVEVVEEKPKIETNKEEKKDKGERSRKGKRRNKKRGN